MLETSSNEHDRLLIEAAAAAELRQRLITVSAERDALSEQCGQLQRDVRQQEAAGMETKRLSADHNLVPKLALQWRIIPS